MEAYEALIAGVLGVATFFAYHQRQDPVDRLSAVVLLWICITGIAGMLLTQLPDPSRFIALGIRFTGPPLLLLLCEESVRTKSYGGKRMHSVLFAVVILAAAIFAFVWFGGRPWAVGQTDNAFLNGIVSTLGISALSVWLLLTLICGLGALLTVVPAIFAKRSPGLGGMIAVVLLASEFAATMDSTWSRGAIWVVSYRTILTLALAAIAVVKARGLGPSWLAASGGTLPLPFIDRPKRKASAQTSEDASEGADEADEDDTGASEKPESSKPRRSKAPKSKAGKTKTTKGNKRRKK